MADELPQIAVGMRQIAQMLGVDRRTPSKWRYRKVLPPPDHTPVNNGPAWLRTTILRWADDTGRLPDTHREDPC